MPCMAYRQNGGALFSCNGCVKLRSLAQNPSVLFRAKYITTTLQNCHLSLPQLRSFRIGAPLALQGVVMEPQSAGSPTSPSFPGTPSSESTKLSTPSEEMPPSGEPSEEAALKPDRQSSSSSSSSSSSEAESLFHLDAAEISSPLVAAPDNYRATPGDVAEVKAEDWASWLEQPAQTVDDPFLPDDGTVFTEMTQAPQVQTMLKTAEDSAAPAVDNGFDPERIPASVFQTKSSSSQAEWSVASNESLFSIHGASQSGELGGLYASSRSHFDYFYDEAMAASGGAEPEWKLPTVAEGSELSDAFDAAGGHGAKEFAMPGSARSDASEVSARAKKAVAFGRHESGSGGSSSNFSFAFPILAETSPKKKECAGGGALYQPLQKECEQPPPLPAPMSAFEEMTTEEERRTTGWCWCGECCGCCWFACSWSSCCCCCQWRWWCCDCHCSCPRLCRCNWCICF